MTQIFAKYADFYDALYREKDYAGECDYLIKLWDKFSGVKVGSVLDFGCGTGCHSYLLAKRGYKVTGIDRSAEMLKCAENKMASLSTSVRLQQAELNNLKLDTTFDAVISMFAVVGYLTDNQDLCALLNSVYEHLHPGGLFVFDVWHGPAVLRQLPETRAINFEKNGEKFRRQATPHLDYAKNVVQVDYTISTHEHGPISKESHRMRYFFLPELELLASFHQFSIEAIYRFLSFDQPTEADWNITVVLKK